MDHHNDEHPDYENKVLDLTNQEDDAAEEGPGYICDHCEIPMREAEEDILSGKEVIVRQGQYYCTCGMIHDPQQQQRVMKSQEKTGPVIPKPSNDFFFESITSGAGLTRTREESFFTQISSYSQLYYISIM